MTEGVVIMSLLDLSGVVDVPLRAPLMAEMLAWSASASKVLAMVLWTGLAILTVSLLVLMRTRWGQAQPLSKCVVLSVFAHVLFIAYAYGTRLIFDAPTPPQDQVIRLAFVEHDANAADAPRQQRAWDRYPAEFAITPDVSSPTQQTYQAPLDTPSVVAEQPDFPIAVREAPTASAGVDAARPEPSTPAAETFEPVEPTEIEVAQPEPVAQPPAMPILPAPDPLERRAAEQLAQPADTPAVTTEAPNSIPDSSTLQRLTEVDFSADIAEARRAAIDMTAAADNRANATRQQSLDTALAMVADAADSPAGVLPVASGGDQALASRRLGDGQPLPDAYQLRNSRDRQAIVEQRGGNQQTEQAVEAALKWLAAHQEADGRWDVERFGGGHETKVLGHDRKRAGMQADTGITGLALLAFLSAGHTHFEGEHRRVVQRGLEFILAQQAADGNLAGAATLFARMYCHGMATLAISEAYAMTGDHRMRVHVERAVRFTINSQDRSTGGWRYQPADRGDMSQFGWQVMALKSAELAGITIPGETRAGMIRFLHSVSKGEHRGLASYRPSERPSETMTAEALACRFFLDIQLDERAVNEAVTYVGQQLPSDGQANLYYWYYATLALFQAQSVPAATGEAVNHNAWQQWNEALQQQLLARQNRSGDNAGSFSPDTVWGSYGGRVYATAMASLCLEVYYRYLPVYEPGLTAATATRNVPQYRVLR